MIPFPSDSYIIGAPKINIARRLFLLNKQISSEARSFMTDHCTAYLPVFQGRSYNRSEASVTKSVREEGAKFLTAFYGLTKFLNVHVHCNHLWLAEELFEWTLYNTICFLVVHSASLCVGADKHRHVTLHLDHYYP